jgi:hypothetical protein
MIVHKAVHGAISKQCIEWESWDLGEIKMVNFRKIPHRKPACWINRVKKVVVKLNEMKYSITKLQLDSTKSQYPLKPIHIQNSIETFHKLSAK